jgi:hypothetical protein
MMSGVNARRSSHSRSIEFSHRPLNAQSEKSVLFLKKRQNATPASQIASRWETAILQQGIRACVTWCLPAKVPDIPFNGNAKGKADIRTDAHRVTVQRPEGIWGARGNISRTIQPTYVDRASCPGVESAMSMSPRYQHETYMIRRKFFQLFGGTFHVYGPNDELVFFSKQKRFKLKEDIRLYSDESATEEVLTIHARSWLDFAAA